MCPPHDLIQYDFQWNIGCLLSFQLFMLEAKSQVILNDFVDPHLVVPLVLTFVTLTIHFEIAWG
jgi:hypothetical protein